MYIMRLPICTHTYLALPYRPTHTIFQQTNSATDTRLALPSHNPPIPYHLSFNKQRDWKTGKSSQATSNVVDTKLREDLERLKKVRYVGD